MIPSEKDPLQYPGTVQAPAEANVTVAGGEPLTLFVNLECDNEATLGATMQEEIDEFGEITWRELITEVRGEELPDEDSLAEWLEENYGIKPSDLEKIIDSEAIDAHYTELEYQSDNLTGAEAQAYDLVQDLGIITLDEWGDGSSHGVHLWRTTANGPRKFLVIDDQAAADWLINQFRVRGLHLQVTFV